MVTPMTFPLVDVGDPATTTSESTGNNETVEEDNDEDDLMTWKAFMLEDFYFYALKVISVKTEIETH
jgi:hypothetical protein